MRIHRQILVLALASAVPLAAFAAQQARGKGGAAKVSVGEFATMLASATETGPAQEARRAVDSLVKGGVPLGDLSATLTERKLAENLDFYGVKASTSNPEQAVSKARAEAALLLIGGAEDRARSTGKSASKVSPSPQTMDDCLAESNHGQCVNCCKALGTTTATRCSKFCMQINKPSSPEPIP